MTAQPYKTKAELSWLRPEAMNGLIRSYEIKLIRDGDEDNPVYDYIPLTTYTGYEIYTIRNLVPGTNYEVEVRVNHRPEGITVLVV